MDVGKNFRMEDFDKQLEKIIGKLFAMELIIKLNYMI
jgi:hypothetical protein